jgi:3-isopropylmalate dehydrogenase
MLPSASIGDRYALYEPVHGSAPDIAGQNKANPIGMICSVAMMFEYTLKMKQVSEIIYNSISNVLDEGYRTADIALPGEKVLTTKEITALIKEMLKENMNLIKED